PCPARGSAQTNIGQKHVPGLTGLGYVIPNRPYRQVEYWQHGQRIDPEIGKAISDRILSDFMRENPLPT
ncbi:hypothetical protein SDB63_24635, partial [Brucella sp. NBRC 113783]|nr:hypothetical protein [Brucella sp. NBRC 113783]